MPASKRGSVYESGRYLTQRRKGGKNPGEYEILRICKTKNFYQKLLSLSTPWSINDVELRMDKLKVTVRLIHQTFWLPGFLASWRFRCRNVMGNVPQTDSKGTEVDVIPESPAGEIVGIEVKVTKRSRAEDLSGLRRPQFFVGERFRRRVLLHTCDRAISPSKDLFAMCLGALWKRYAM
jgi:hypothetical protein